MRKLHNPLHRRTNNNLKKAAQKVKADIKKAHKEVKNDTTHIPQVEVPAELAEKKSAVKTVAKKKSAAFTIATDLPQSISPLT